MESAILALVLAGGFIYASISNRRTKKRRIKQNIREKYGRVPDEKETLEKAVYNYYETCSKHSDIDEVTWNDLSMDEVYLRINNCDSSVGEELLYAQLHDTQRTMEQDELLERRITFCEQEEERFKVEEKLTSLGKDKTLYYIPSYMQTLSDFRIPNMWLYRLFQVLLVLGIVLAAVLHNAAGGVLLIIILALNLTAYSVTVRGKFDNEIAMLTSSMYLVTTARALYEEHHGNGICDELEEYLGYFEKMDKKMFLLAAQAGQKNGDGFEVLQDFLLGATMWHIITYDKVMRCMEAHVSEYMEIYRIIGELDAAVSIGSFRKSLVSYVLPEYTDERRIVMEEIYHPLLKDPVCNSADMGRSCIITGSNASGKSTFIKTVAVNVILAQSIHTCSAQRMVLPRALMITSMAVRDDIMSGDSYFIKEIKYLKRIMDEMSKERMVICVIDEILRGTNTLERIAASKAILEYLSRKNCLAIVASHDRELTELTGMGYDNYHFTEQAGEHDIMFDYKLRQGPADSKNAIRLLELAGFPESVVKRAKAIAALE